jgi:hypothetical protein
MNKNKEKEKRLSDKYNKKKARRFSRKYWVAGIASAVALLGLLLYFIFDIGDLLATLFG